METLKLLTSNYLINVCLLAWFLAQLLKVLLTFIDTKKLTLERFVGSGGMPSSHSAFVCSLTIATVRKFGFASPLFAISLALAAIVMYDAMGVRRAAGEQAKVLNKILSSYKAQSEGSPEEKIPEQLDSVADKTLKEFLGHTPLEVLGGALLGILVAMVMPVA